MPYIWSRGCRFAYRTRGQDRNIIRSISSEYGLLPLSPGSSVLDLGGHIGSFACWAKQRGAVRVLSVEPDPSNFRLLRKNIEGHEGLTAINAAVMADPAPSNTTLYRSQYSEASHSLYDSRAAASQYGKARPRTPIRVSVIGLNEALELSRAEVVKIDIEGYEYDLLKRPYRLPASVRALAIECHLTRKMWQTACLDLLSWLSEQGFRPLKPTTGGRWAGHYGGQGVWQR